MDAAIIEVALNGVTAKDVNPRVPRTPAEVTADALRCVELGASIVHNHTDDALWYPPSGIHDPTPYIEAWTPLLEAHPDVLTYPTMGSGGNGIAVADRWGHHDALVAAGVLRVGLVDPGSVSLTLPDERGVPYPIELAYVNTPADAQYMVDGCRRLGLAPSISIFDPSFLRLALAHHRAGTLPPGSLVKLYFGGPRGLFGLPPTPTSLDAYLAMLDGTGLPWLVAVLGGDAVESGLAAYALQRGGHVRVGLEDHAGARTPGNAELVAELAEEVVRAGRRVASPQETARILGVAPRPV